MGLFKRLLGSSTDRVAPSGAVTLLDEGLLVGLELKGESNYQAALWQAIARRNDGSQQRVETVAVLVPEPDNIYDGNAVYASVKGAKVGYLSKDDAAIYQPGVIRLMRERGSSIAVEATIVGGRDHDGRPGMLGVWLRLNPLDFGLPAPLSPDAQATKGIYTGASVAVRGQWMDELPDQDIKAINRLRTMLGTEADACERHFIYLELESRLYKSREAFASALDEFAQICDDHHSEMHAIRPILLERVGGVPSLPTYRQAAIMWQKRGNHGMALRWAERGLEQYGTEALRPEDVDDLQKRVTRHRTTLSKQESS